VKNNRAVLTKRQKSSKKEREEAFYLYDKAGFVLNVRKKLIFVKYWLKLSEAKL